MTDKLPNFIVVGAARCGTSWLAKNLSKHPEIFMPSYKEVHFFDEHYDKGIEWYRDIFVGKNEPVVGEATPAYLFFKEIPELIHKHVPDVKIIVSLRNPVERAYSHYWNLIAKAKKGDKNFGISFEDKIKMTPRLVEEGEYSERLEKYYKSFPANNIKIMFYDDLVSHPDKFLRDVYGFLGVDKDFIPPIVNSRVNAADTKMGKSKILFFLHKVAMRIGLYKFSKWVDDINRPTLPKMKEHTKNMLMKKHYLSEISKLEEMLGHDLSAWR